MYMQILFNLLMLPAIESIGLLHIQTKLIHLNMLDTNAKILLVSSFSSPFTYASGFSDAE